MRNIQIRLRAPDKFSEFLENDTEQAELMIENIVAEALLQFFDTIVVDSVTVQHVPEYSEVDTVQSGIESNNL
ncbi:MAG TPA: hypothetical protein DHW02_18695 [Ktedonobacter sp.]|nr:hypothetical protein [Ktedonobacter sp.]